MVYIGRVRKTFNSLLYHFYGMFSVSKCNPGRWSLVKGIREILWHMTRKYPKFSIYLLIYWKTVGEANYFEQVVWKTPIVVLSQRATSHAYRKKITASNRLAVSTVQKLTAELVLAPTQPQWSPLVFPIQCIFLQRAKAVVWMLTLDTFPIGSLDTRRCELMWRDAMKLCGDTQLITCWESTRLRPVILSA